jgi:hypothetical protein
MHNRVDAFCGSALVSKHDKELCMSAEDRGTDKDKPIRVGVVGVRRG